MCNKRFPREKGIYQNQRAMLGLAFCRALVPVMVSPIGPLPTTLRACRWGPFPFAHVLWPFLWVRGASRLLLLQFSGVHWERARPAKYTSSWFRYLVHDRRRNTLWFAPRDSVVNLFWICDEERKPIFTAVVKLSGVSLPFASSRNFALIDVCKY